MLNAITYIFCCSITAIFLLLTIKARKISSISAQTIRKALLSQNTLADLSGSKLSSIVDAYKKTIDSEINGSKKSAIPSSEYFSEFSVCNAFGINTKQLDAGSGILVGLGLLGTFLGLTLGIQGFDSSNSENIQNSIQTLLSGMGTAFLTSLFGMTLSLIFTYLEKRYRNNLAKSLYEFTQKVDDAYYVDDVQLITYNQSQLIKEMTTALCDDYSKNSEKLIERLSSLLEYTVQNGEKIPISNAIREILLNNQEQTKALKSFSTDLALELNDRLDETLSRQMQQRLIPLLESVDLTTKSVVEHIDQMASSVSSPATDMMEHVVSELKSSLMNIMEQFKATLSKNATNELENLAISLASATSAMGEFPQRMANISEVLQLTISEVRKAISEISNTYAAASTDSIKQMQDQIVFATTSISNAIAEVKDVMTSITLSSEVTSNSLIEKIAKSTDQMTLVLGNTMEQISGAMQKSLQSMTSDIADQQTSLLDLQEGTTGEVRRIVSELSETWKQSSESIIKRTENLLSRFDNSIDCLNSTNVAVSGTMGIFQQAQSNISGTTSHLQSITSDMRSATELFKNSQSEYVLSLRKLECTAQDKMSELMCLFEQAGHTTNDYADKFEVIRLGLNQIFSQIQTGLNEYSNSVRGSIQKYLDVYATSLTNTTDALSSTIQQQNEMVEMLVETVSRKK